jgi:hypothetical protein
MELTKDPGTGRRKNWLKKIGLVGFLFFLIKGLIWLIIGYVIIN